jgi:hypothetical protein
MHDGDLQQESLISTGKKVYGILQTFTLYVLMERRKI